MKKYDELRRKTLKSLLTGGLAGLVGVSGWTWLMSQEEEDGIPWPFRRVLDWNQSLWSRYYRQDRLGKRPESPPVGSPTRKNGDIGFSDPVDLNAWRLTVESPADFNGPRRQHFSLRELQWLPKTESTTEFKCIEGWSENFAYGGVRFSDFMRYLGIGTRSGKGSSDFYPYVGFRTPDERYYVSVDMQSMLHSQTLIAYEMNGKVLTPAHGAPARLVIPVKYGIKSLKRIGTVFFSDTRPPDYWAERGYDWYAGL